MTIKYDRLSRLVLLLYVVVGDETSIAIVIFFNLLEHQLYHKPIEYITATWETVVKRIFEEMPNETLTKTENEAILSFKKAFDVWF